MKKIGFPGIILVLCGLFLVGAFWYFLFKTAFGLFLVTAGACFAVIGNTAWSKPSLYIGGLGAFLFPIGVIYSFIFDGWIIGLLSIFMGFFTDRLAK